MVPVAVPEVGTKEVLWNSVLETNMIPGSSSTGSGTGKWLLWCESASWQQVQVQSWSVKQRTFISNTPGLRAKTQNNDTSLHPDALVFTILIFTVHGCLFEPRIAHRRLLGETSSSPVHVWAETKCLKTKKTRMKSCLSMFVARRCLLKAT